MCIDRELDHLKGRDMLSLVARMRLFCERKIPERVHFLLGCRRPCRVDLHIAVLYRLHQHRWLKHIGICLHHMEVLGKGYLVLAATLIRVEYDCILGPAFAVHIEGKLRYLPDIVYITSGFDSLRKLYHRPLPHSVAEPVGAAVHKNGRLEGILPVVVMGNTS